MSLTLEVTDAFIRIKYKTKNKAQHPKYEQVQREIKLLLIELGANVVSIESCMSKHGEEVIE